MIDLRMVVDDHGYMQLQVRKLVIGVDAGGNLCDGGDWLEWKSVPIVHDPAQLVDRVEIFDARSSGAKPDGGLTGKQLTEVFGELEEAVASHLKNAQKVGVNNERYYDHQQGMADGISKCLEAFKAKLSPQPAEPEIDL
jgi:hypothetical protein